MTAKERRIDTPRTDLSPVQLDLLLGIVVQAESVLTYGGINSARFTELPENGAQVDYIFKTDKASKKTVLAINSGTTSMRILRDEVNKTTVIADMEDIFGSFTETVIAEESTGDLVIKDHYTNDSSGLDSTLALVRSRLEFVKAELARIGHKPNLQE